MAEQWMARFGGKCPTNIIYYRDGVSAAQYTHVLEQEVADMKQLFRQMNPIVKPKFTVIICAKRHHIRFFPVKGNGDKNGNPHPGTLVDTGSTHPFEFDFYLAAHSAIKGTARPVHYHVIKNECGFSSELIQQLTFEHCFQYARSTTPVSMFPAVYYAHLASNRAKAHENRPAVSSGKKETHERKERETAGQSTESSFNKDLVEIPPLMAMNNQLLIRQTMWYI
jgi:eukaryotic translation initiation factor 2C